MKLRKEKKGEKPSADKATEEKDVKTVKKAEAILVDDGRKKAAPEKKNKDVFTKVKKGINQVSAKARYLRISPKKVRLVINIVRGMKATEALDKLQFINKKATGMVIKLLNSALANAENNFKLNKGDLYIKKIIANEGPTLNRWRARAFGRAGEIRKRSTHLEVILATKEGLKETAAKRETVKHRARPVLQSEAGEVKPALAKKNKMGALLEPVKKPKSEFDKKFSGGQKEESII